MPRGLVSLALLAGVLGCSGAPDPSAAPAPTTPPNTAATTTTTAVPDEAGRAVDDYAPAVGDCFDLRSRRGPYGGETTYHLLVDCAQPHEHEVFAVLPAAEPGAPHPGAEALRRLARRECPPRFDEYVGLRYELSIFGLDFELPTPEQWEAWPSVACTLTGPDGTRTAGSARATGR